MKNKKRTITTIILILLIAPVIYMGVRQTMTKLAVEREWRTTPIAAYTPETTSHLEIIPLYEEATTDPDLISGHGVSYLVRTDSASILLDVGDNPDQLATAPFLQNMEKLGIEWDEVDRIVISHPHPDHIGGIEAWKSHTVSISGLELPVGLDERLIFVPTPVKFKGTIHATAPTLPAPDVATTGVISYPEVFPLSLFEPKGAEQALVVHVAGEGLVLITGCGHPTLEHLVIRAETLYDLPVIGVVGGLHYEDAEATDVAPAIEFLASRSPRLVALSPHDSSQSAIEAFRSAFPEAYQEIAVGRIIQFPKISVSLNGAE